MNELQNIIESSERLEWGGKPQANSYFMSKIPIFIFSIGFFSLMLYLTKNQNSNFILWIYGLMGFMIFMIILIILSYRVTFYGITNKRLIFQSGIIGRDFKSIDYDQIKNISVNVGVVDRIFNTGTIKVFTGEMETTTSYTGGNKNRNASAQIKARYDNFNNIPNPYEILKKVQMHLTKRKENLYAGRT